ncbi:MAG: glycosyltransferase [Candidatus Shapirobacteria bacterium]|nr:glycosyltransferase [Candidatus Shapirobacteria bacterium]MDD4410518.1 glycosyltransferase [Candidatus Shapirobacteria bacterium]
MNIDFEGLKKLINDNIKLKIKLSNLEKHQDEINIWLEKIYNAKSYRLWEKYCFYRDRTIKSNPIKTLIKSIVPLEWKYNIKKFLSYFDTNKKEFEKCKKILLNDIVKNQEIKEINKKVSILIPTKNAGPLFEIVLKKIISQKYIKQLEVVILDSGSTDNTLKIAKDFDVKIINIKPEDFSHSSTRNIGAKFATGDYLLFTVQDAFFLNDKTIYDLINLLEKTGSIAGSTRQIPRSDADIFSSWQIDEFTKYISPNKKDIVVDIDKKTFINLPIEKQRSFCTIDDVCSIFLKKEFDKIGGFNEKLKYGEDLDIGKRLIESGKKIVYLCSNGVIHSHTRSASYFLKRYYVDTIFLKNIFNKNIVENNNINYNPNDLLYIFSKLGISLEKKYSLKDTNKKSTFTSLDIINDLLKNFKNRTNNKKLNYKIIQNELDAFLKFQLNKINLFIKIENLSSNEIALLVDKIFAIFVANNLANYFLINNSKYPKLKEINKILENGV